MDSDAVQRRTAARVRAVAHRTATGTTGPGTETVQRVGPLRLDRRTHRLQINGQEVALTLKEFALLALLAERPGVVSRRSEIIELVSHPNWHGRTRSLEAHVASLRNKLGDPTLIDTVLGIGYRLNPS